jgi:hypothetical protein
MVPMIPELVKRNAARALAQFAERRSEQLESCWDGSSVSVHCRACDHSSLPIARFNYVDELHQWFLYAPGADRNWRPCLEVSAEPHLLRLLNYLEEDPLNQFWNGEPGCCS